METSTKVYTPLTIWAICTFRLLNPHKTVCWHYICLNYSFEAGIGNPAYTLGVGPILSVVRGRGLISRNDGGWSGRAGFERGCIRDTARIQRVFIGDQIPSSIRVGNVLPDHTRPSHKNMSALVGGWWAVWCGRWL